MPLTGVGFLYLTQPIAAILDSQLFLLPATIPH